MKLVCVLWAFSILVGAAIGLALWVHVTFSKHEQQQRSTDDFSIQDIFMMFLYLALSVAVAVIAGSILGAVIIEVGVVCDCFLIAFFTALFAIIGVELKKKIASK